MIQRLVPFALVTMLSVAASAQPTAKRRLPAPSPPPAASAKGNLRAHVGTDHAAQLIHSADPEERIRGIERAASIGTPEAVALLVETLERNAAIKADTRSLLTMARALSRFAAQERVRAALLTIVGSGNPSFAGRLPQPRSSSADRLEDGDPALRAELARQVAAIALARSGGDRALESLYGVARAAGSGQSAALVGLATYPPRDPGVFGAVGASIPAATIRLLGQLGDLRALDILHGATRSSDVGVRSAALVALAELGDERAHLLARTAIAESDVRLRAASGEVFILLGAPERFKATAALLSDEATVWIGVRMAERVFGPEITKLVAARAFEHPDRELRAAAIRALGRSPDPAAATALVAPQLVGDNELAYHALAALARSPAPNAGALISGLFPTRLRTLAARAYVVRALVRGERTSSADDEIARMASSRLPPERALGVLSRVALGDDDLDTFLSDKDARVRRAAAIGSMARRSSAERCLLAALVREKDPLTRQVLSVGLLGGDPEGTIKTSELVDRAESGGGDAALATFAFARRADETTARKLGELLGSKDPVIRSHAARGLAIANLPDASGRLADAYAYETDAEVRRAIIAGLAARTADVKAPLRKQTLELASELDPDGPVRQAARRALAGVVTPFAGTPTEEVAWLRLTRSSGDPPGEAYVGSVVRSDGIAVPIAFDEEGYALVPGLPPGESRLVLAPRLPTYHDADSARPPGVDKGHAKP